MWVFGGDLHEKHFAANDVLLFLFYICIMTGLILSWPKEKWGIILTYAGVAGLIITQLYKHEHDVLNLLYLLAPATLLLICRLAEKK